ncbi:MAG: radical SAM protein [Candidatus Kaiserbacteria bacterium]|nr:radical SAM protein [Candidatus Kaiserbacteria bacterium]
MLARYYVALADDFTLKHSKSVSNLYCLRTGVIYELQPDQTELLQLLDGSCTVEEIVNQYSEDSRVEVMSLIEDLKALSALCFTSECKLRSIQTKKVPDERLESVHLELSGVCNMSCAHCYQKRYVDAKESLGYKQILCLLDDLEEMQVSNVGISGGEPLMMRQLPEILKAVEERDIRIGALFTNGTLVTCETVEMIAHLKSRFPILVSLDSLPDYGYAFRGYNSKRIAQRMLRRIIQGVKLLVNKGVPVVINTMITSENVDNLLQMYDMLMSIGVNGWRLGFPKPTGQFRNTESIFGVSWSRIAESYLSLLRFHFEKGMPLDLQIEYVFRRQFIEGSIPQLTTSDFVCDYEERRSGCCVKPNGDVVSCPYCSELPMGNIKVASIRDIWYSDQMKRTKALTIGEVEACKECELIDLCGTGCRANAFFLHGDFSNGKDDHACLAVAFFKERVLPLLEKYNSVPKSLVKRSF